MKHITKRSTKPSLFLWFQEFKLLARYFLSPFVSKRKLQPGQGVVCLIIVLSDCFLPQSPPKHSVNLYLSSHWVTYLCVMELFAKLNGLCDFPMGILQKWTGSSFCCCFLFTGVLHVCWILKLIPGKPIMPIIWSHSVFHPCLK